jgi:hypothetical protein
MQFVTWQLPLLLWMNKFRISSVYLILLSAVCIQPAFAIEAKSRYVTLQYSDKRVLREFNNKLIIGRKLSSVVRKRNVESVEDEVLAKADVIMEKVQVVLDMFPDKIYITLVLLPDDDDVAAKYKESYGKHQKNIAYYALSEKTIYISVDDTNLRVLAHEIGHAVTDQYFKVRPPYKIHELMAQFAEKHVTD